MLSSENAAWINAFKKRYRRAPTVIHVGNIANNAYNNAKLLNQAGFECDVICYDYYHSMGAPEWEDADLIGVVADDFAPDWAAVCAQQYRRPRWFAQGPFALCADYLQAKNSSKYRQEQSLWLALSHYNKCLVSTNGAASQINLFKFLNKRSIVHLFVLRYRLAESSRKAARKIIRIVQVLRGPPHQLKGGLEIFIDTRFPVGDAGKIAVLGFSLTLAALCRPIADLCAAAWKGARSVRAIISTKYDKYQQLESSKVAAKLDVDPFQKEFVEQFPDRLDLLSDIDMHPYRGVFERWHTLLHSYDFVVAYSTDPILPMLCSKKYFAFEHGTIREIPYKNDATGRLSALAYRLAEHVFVTNFDCKASAEYLAPGRYTLINHPYDEDHGAHVGGADGLRKELCNELDCDFLIFHPTRQDWVAGTGYADKNNDEFLNAFVCLRRRGLRIGLICCEWGRNVEQSKALLHSADCSRYVRWIPSQAITPFERYCIASDVVADQFKLGAFGGVVFKAMAVGTPILTYLDVERLSAQYPEPPPVINCRTQDEIIAALEEMYRSPEKYKGLGSASRDWMKRCHSKQQTINAQVNQFRLHFPVEKRQSLF